MATVNFYLDKVDKQGLAPIHLRINCDGTQVKISTGKKVVKSDFDKANQAVKSNNKEAQSINNYLTYLKDRAEELLNGSYKKRYTTNELKELLLEQVNAYKQDSNVSVVKEQMALYGKPITFIDLFAGAGGFSEGFLQAEENNKFFDFLVANDINENSELTHVVRYNEQLGLDAKFLCQDITEPDFIDNLLTKVNGKTVDVVCGGPPCQSFSLAGKRKKFDKKDDLFSHYLEVIKILRPKYFVMENVKGILTKEQGKIKDVILQEINSIVDIQEIPKLTSFLKTLKKSASINQFLLDCFVKRIEFESVTDVQIESLKESYIKSVDAKFRQIIPKMVDYRTSKTDERVSTIRHGFNMLIRNKQWEKLKRDIIKEKDFCNIDNDFFVGAFTDFLTELDNQSIINKIESAFSSIGISQEYKGIRAEILTALKVYDYSFEECINAIAELCSDSQKVALSEIIDSIKLYRIEAPFVANASNYGVPQNRERVLFIGCRKDQPFISQIPHTVSDEEKVSVFEALYDLDFIGNNEEARYYQEVDLKSKYNGSTSKMMSLIKQRGIDGKLKSGKTMTFAEWSKTGRLIDRYKNASAPFYVRNFESLERGEKSFDPLHNHKTSNQSEDVVNRLEIILNEGDYKQAQEKLEKEGLSSNKRNYNVLKPDKQSPTVMTIPDDYVHYNSPRALTVREMARLQSFDDSFVFQGKRSTGGNNRKTELPQFTLVGNAVPPLLARAVASEILKNIK